MNYKLLLSSLAITTPWLVFFLAKVNYYGDYFKTKLITPDNNGAAYDFIVVGSGAGGAVVAHRLSTNKNIKVLLLEAGGDPSTLNQIPGLALDVLNFEYTDWQHLTIPQKFSCFGLYNNQSSWNAGKVLGGSTTLNYLLYLRGSPYDYDNWANLTGDPSWSYENLIPFFKKSIKHYRGNFGANTKHYSESPYGFLTIEGRPWAPLKDQFLAAGKEFGFPEIDVNSNQRTGFGIAETTQDRGWRGGTYYAILKDLENRNNVKISRFSHVTKIKLSKDLVAEGVWYLHHGVKKFARATKEVIVSGGSVNSPKLLMLSGIGPKNHLKSLGIKTKLDLPVGKNLHDHFVVPLIPFVIDKPFSFLATRDFGPSAFYQWLSTGQGILSTPTTAHSQLFYSTESVRKTGKDWPDIQTLFGPIGMFDLFSDAFSRGTNFRLDGLKEAIDDSAGKDGFILIPSMVRPKSRGELLLASKDPMERPLIDPRYMEHPDDAKAMIEGVKKMVEIFENAKAFKEINAHFPMKHLKFCKSHKLRSDAYWECYIRHWTMSEWHPVSTCKMGKAKGDKTAVVNTKLRVIGARGLRVADASIMPEIVNANTMAPSMMIGEKASDMIRDYWQFQYQVSDLKNHIFFNKLQCFYTQFM